MKGELVQSDEAMTYLIDRGLEPDTIIEAQLGYVPRSWGGLFWHSIAIPYFDAQGRWRTTRYRHLRPNPRHKYDVAKGSRQHLYGIEDIQEPVVYITEGEFDRLILRQMGYPSVGIAGVTNFARPWRFLFRSCDLVLIVKDHDTKPRAVENVGKAMQRIASWIGQVTDVDIIELPLIEGTDKTDVTDLYLKDPEELKRLCEVGGE